MARIRRAPVLKHALETALGDVELCEVLGHIGQAESGKRSIEHLKCAVENELAFDAHLEFAGAFLELPGVQPAMRGQTRLMQL